MGFTPYCCGRCWKYQLLGRARESCPYLQPRVQVMGNPMALQGMNQNGGGGSLYIFTSAREHQCWRLQATTARGWAPSFRGITPQNGAVWRAISHLTWWLYSCHQAAESVLERRRRLNCIDKKVPQDLQSSADEGNSPCTPSLCQGLVAEPRRLRTLNSKLEEFGTVQGSPSNFASIPQQCLCLLNIFWV